MAADTKPSLLMGLIVPLLVLTLAAGGGGTLIGMQIVASVKAAHGAEPDEAAKPPGVSVVKELAPIVANTQIANLYQQFAQGDFAMYVTGPWNVGEFKHRLPVEMQGRWATAPLPARDGRAPIGTSMAGGSSLVVFRASRHKAAAEKLIEFLSTPEEQLRLFAATGDLPARKSAWSAPELAGDPYFPAFRLQLERVDPLPKVPEWEQIANAMYEHGEAAVRRARTEDEALSDLDRAADEILTKRRWILARKAGAR